MKREGHYKNTDFVENLIAASGNKTLEEAAPQWRFSHFGAEEKSGRHCQLCHSSLKLWVAIRNTANGVVLFIGHDCYDKLVTYLATKKLESVSLGSRRQHISAIRKYCHKNITESFLTWFKEQDAPAEFKETLKFIEEFGYAPTLEAAEAIVLFYKTTRRFPLMELKDGSAPAETLDAFLWGTGIENFWQKGVSLADYEALIGLMDGFDGDEFRDRFFREALRKTLPPGLSPEQLLRAEVMGPWIENARKMRPAVLDEAWKIAVIDLQRMIAENQEEYRLLAFYEGRNPKHGTVQWESRSGSRVYVLGRESSYSMSEGPVLVRVVRELVPGRIFLVSKTPLPRLFSLQRG